MGAKPRFENELWPTFGGPPPPFFLEGGGGPPRILWNFSPGLFFFFLGGKNPPGEKKGLGGADGPRIERVMTLSGIFRDCSLRPRSLAKQPCAPPKPRRAARDELHPAPMPLAYAPRWAAIWKTAALRVFPTPKGAYGLEREHTWSISSALRGRRRACPTRLRARKSFAYGGQRQSQQNTR